MVKTPERSEYTLFTEIYYTSRPGLAVTKSPRAAPLSMEDLTQRPPGSPPVTFPAGFYYQEYFDTHHPQTSYQTVPTTQDALKKVLFGESFAALGDRPVLEHLIQHHQLQSLQVVPLLQAPQFSTPLRLGVHRGNPQLAELLRRAARAGSPQEKALLKARWMESRRGSSAPRLTLEEQLYLDQREELTLVTDPGWTPLAFINSQGEHAGIADEYLDTISRRLGTPIRLIPTDSWQESWDLVRRGKADLVSALMETPERRKFCLFTQPYLEDPFVITVREGAPFAASIRDIADKKIGVVDDYATEQILRENYPELQLVEVPSIQDGLSRVSSREIYAFVDSLATVSYELGRQRLMDLKIAGQLPEQWTISFGVNPEEELLVPILNKALDTITPEEKQDIWEKWLRINFDHTVNRTLLRNLLLGAAAVAFLGLWRYLLVRKKNYQLRDLNRRLEHLSITDPLTQLYNRLKMDRVLQDESAGPPGPAALTAC